VDAHNGALLPLTEAGMVIRSLRNTVIPEYIQINGPVRDGTLVDFQVIYSFGNGSRLWGRLDWPCLLLCRLLGFAFKTSHTWMAMLATYLPLLVLGRHEGVNWLVDGDFRF